MISEEGRQRLRESKLGANNPMFGKPCRHKDKISATLKGRMPKNLASLHSPENIRKATEGLIKFNKSEEGKRINREKSLGEKNPFYGKKHTEETIQKIIAAHKGVPSPLRGRIRPEITGENSYNWKGGEATLRKRLAFYEARRRARKVSNGGGRHTLEEWDDLKKLYNYMCLCCKQQEPFIKLTEDHIIPLSLGGTDGISNIQPLCRECNSRKLISTRNYINNTTILL